MTLSDLCGKPVALGLIAYAVTLVVVMGCYVVIAWRTGVDPS